jgi:signal transduction histidine kinase
MIKEEVRRLDDRVKDFLAFARVKPLNLEKVNLNALVTDIAKNFSSRTNPRFRIELHLAEQKPWLLGDADQLHQAVVNLVINADQAMPNGGTLSMETETIEDSVVLRLTDEGSGISAVHRDRIFEPFFTTKKEGTGLGLAIVHQIATAHRGKITIRNREEGESGVMIELRLPAACILR